MFDSVRRRWFFIRFDSFFLSYFWVFFLTFDWEHTHTHGPYIYLCKSRYRTCCVLLECHTYFPFAIFDRWEGDQPKGVQDKEKMSTIFLSFSFFGDFGSFPQHENRKCMWHCCKLNTQSRDYYTYSLLLNQLYVRKMIDLNHTRRPPGKKKKIIWNWIQSICVVV